jgi:hypothetical protein
MRKFISLIVALILAAIGAPVFAQTASAPFTAPLYYASSFGTWSLNGQSPNTYIFQGRSLCSSAAQNLNFFVFNTNAPVWIADANTANSEVVTPSAVTNTAGSCGITASTANNHYNFQLKSGTGGLQEAVNTLSGQVGLPAIIALDRNWYAFAANVPGKTPQSIIAGITGNTGIVLQDITTSPATFYSWNGTAYAFSAAVAGFPNLKVTSFTQIAAPTALSTAAAANGLITTATTGGTIPASSTYRLAATYVDASGGETLISTDTASTATIATGSGTATNTLTVTSPAAATGAVGWRLYVTAASGAAASEILYSPTCTGTQLQAVFVPTTVCAIGATATVTAIVTGTATIPSTGSAYPRTSGSSGILPPFTALGTVASAATGTLGVVNIPAGWMNTLGRSFEVCGNGYATVNGTTGTLTLAETLASIPGVTTITPFTVVSGTTTASAQIPINFCITNTTAVTGTTGKLETHGWAIFGLAGTAVGSPVQDTVFTSSSTVDLTKQDQLAITITPTTTGITAAQLRQTSAYPSN